MLRWFVTFALLFFAANLHATTTPPKTPAPIAENAQACANDLATVASITTQVATAATDFKPLNDLRAIIEGKAPMKDGDLRPETLDYYIERAKENSRHAKLPTFTHVEGELAAAATWKTVEAPKMFQQLLPEGVGAIGHSLYGAMAPGVVKADTTGNAVFLRTFVKFKYESGRVEDVATDVVVNVGALVANGANPHGPKYLTEPGTPALIDKHGGGTKGTGPHTGVEKNNIFGNVGVSTISLAGAWHAGGPRSFFSSATEYFNYHAAFIDKFVHPETIKKKEVFYGGHSWGGQLAEMAMRRTDDPNFRLGKQIGMFFVLSNVADAAPGQPVRVKWAEALRREQEARKNRSQDMAEGDNELFDGLVRENKISPIASLGYYTFSLGQEWKMPGHGGSQYTPALVIVGKSDGLTYVGYEDLFRNYLFNLKNVISYEMGPRMTYEGKMERTGHLIMDNKKPNQAPPEALVNPKLKELYDGVRPEETEVYGLMRVAMEKIIGRKLDPKPKESSDLALIAKVIAAWFNNLAFREFAKEFVYYKVNSLDGGKKVQENNGLLVTGKKNVDSVMKNRGLSPDQKTAEIKSILARVSKETGFEIMSVEQLEQVRLDNFARMTHKFVPSEGPMRERAIRNIDLRNQLGKMQQDALDLKAKALILLRGIPNKKDKAGAPGLVAHKNQLERDIRNALTAADRSGESKTFSQRYQNARLKSEEIFERQRAADLVVREQFESHLLQLHESGQLNETNLPKFPPSLRKAIDEYHKLSEDLQQARAETARIAEEEGLASGLNLSLLSLYKKLGEVRREVDRITKEVNEMEYVAHRARTESQLLIKEYVEQIVPGNFEVRVIKLADVLDQDFSRWTEYKWILEPAWSRWTTLWGERPPPGKTDLY